MSSSCKHGISRRNFLTTMACGAVASTAVPRLLRAAEEESAPWEMKLSGSTINYTKLSVEDACQQIADLGFDAVDVWSAHANCPHLDDVLDRLGPNGLQEILKKTGLKLYSFSVYRGGYAKYAELLGKAGGGVAVRGSSKAADASELTTRMKAFLEGLKPELEMAEKYDSYLAIENHGNALLHTVDSFKAFVDLNRHPRLGIALAPYHLQSVGASIPEVIEISGKQLLYFYAWQKGPGIKQLPGIGPVDCTSWIEALAKIEYPWYVNPFMHHEPDPEAMTEALAKSRDYLKDCYGKVVAGK